MSQWRRPRALRRGCSSRARKRSGCSAWRGTASWCADRETSASTSPSLAMSRWRAFRCRSPSELMACGWILWGVDRERRSGQRTAGGRSRHRRPTSPPGHNGRSRPHQATGLIAAAAHDSRRLNGDLRLHIVRASATRNRCASSRRRVRRLEVQGDAVDAVAQAGWRRPVLEDVAEVSTAAAAVHLRAHHPVGAIGGRTDRSLERREEARPAGSAFELAVGDKERLPATGAGERARPMLVEQRARAGVLGRMSAQYPRTARVSGSGAIPHPISRPRTAGVVSPCG